MTRKPEAAGARDPARARKPSRKTTGADAEMELAGQQARQLLAVRFREARDTAGLTQREVHERSGVDIASISRIETASWNPSLNTLVRLALAVSVPVGALLAEGPAGDAPIAMEGETAGDPPGEDPDSEG